MSIHPSVTKQQAEAVLAEVRRVFVAYLDDTAGSGPALLESFEWGAGLAPWAIVWESGPFEWSYLATSGGVDEALTAEGLGAFTVGPIETIPGVYCEPYNSWALAIYPDTSKE